MNIVTAGPSAFQSNWEDRRERLDSARLNDLVRILRRRLRLMLTTVVVIIGAAAIALLFTTPVYKATAVLQLDDVYDSSTTTNPSETDPIRELELKQEYKVRTQIEALKSRAVARGVVRDMALYDDLEFNPGGYPKKERRKGDKSQVDAAKVYAAVPPPIIERTVDKLLSRLEVTQDGGTSYILVTAGSSNPKKAVRLANKVASSYVDAQSTEKRAANRRAIEELGKRTEELGGQLQQAERAVADFKSRNAIDASFAVQAGAAQIERAAAEFAAARGVRAEAGTRSSIQLAGGGASSPLLNDLRGQETGLERKFAELSTQYGRNHPDVRRISAEMGRVRSAIGAESARVVSSVRSESAGASAREGQLGADLNALKARARQQDFAGAELSGLEREVETTKTVFVAMLGRLKELQKLGTDPKPDASLVSRALLPSEPSFPQPRQIMAVASAGAIVFALLLALVVEGLDNRLRTGEQVRRITGLPTFAMIPERGANTQMRLGHGPVVDAPRSVFAESFRDGFLELMARTAHLSSRVVMVTSGLPGEGKTTVALGLAVSAVSARKTAIVLDFDLRRPGLTSLLNLQEQRATLVTYLLGETTLEESIVHVAEAPGLATMVVGAPPENPASLFSEERIAALFAKLRKQFDFIVVDTPPVLAVRDAKILAPFVDASIVTVRWGKSSPDIVQSVTEIMGEALTGVIITRVDYTRHSNLAYGDALQHYSRYSTYYAGELPAGRTMRRWFRSLRHKMSNV